MGLTNLDLTEERKQRLVSIFKNEEITDQMMSTIPSVILENKDKYTTIFDDIATSFKENN